MDPKNPKDHPWQPRIDEQRPLNPSVRTTEPEGSLDERTLEQIEEVTEKARRGKAKPSPSRFRTASDCIFCPPRHWGRAGRTGARQRASEAHSSGAANGRIA